jgi:hypothetical protein
MRRLLLWGVVGVLASVGWAKADGIPRYTPIPNVEAHGFGPHASSVMWPSVYPPGWYTNTYKHQWYFPWYAYYNFTHGPYANWAATGGFAGYAYHGPAGYYYYPNVQPAQPYIGEWQGRVQGKGGGFGAGGAYDSLQGLTAYPLHPPRELKDDKKDKK